MDCGAQNNEKERHKQQRVDKGEVCRMEHHQQRYTEENEAQTEVFAHKIHKNKLKTAQRYKKTVNCEL